ncbi:hypothetical protein BJY04DRAFT_54947 [Aspergillus karnatakaensis]|uniref:uncharacterized protein n=1 Tax=Aspergillus karnatakaensis TaxID=1810916 RepID=UPI003CCCB1BD
MIVLRRDCICSFISAKTQPIIPIRVQSSIKPTHIYNPTYKIRQINTCRPINSDISTSH